MKFLLTRVLFVTIAISAFSQEQSPVKLVHKYLEARNRTMQIDATMTDIENAIAFCTDDFVYEHPAAKAKIEGKDKVRAGMAGYLGFTKNASYKTTTRFSNKNVLVAVVERKFLDKQDDGSWKQSSRTNLTVFEIENGKIKRILDY